MKLEELIEKLEKLRSQYNADEGALLDEIDNHNDGYTYRVVSWVLGASQRREFINFYAAKEFIDYFNGDNGVIDLITDNKKFAEEMASHEGVTGIEIIE